MSTRTGRCQPVQVDIHLYRWISTHTQKPELVLRLTCVCVNAALGIGVVICLFSVTEQFVAQQTIFLNLRFLISRQLLFLLIASVCSVEDQFCACCMVLVSHGPKMECQ